MPALLTIAQNTFMETIRQSVFGVMLMASAAIIMTSPGFAMFTFIDSTKLVQDMGLATILLNGMLLGVLASTTVISREIESGTAISVLSKPVRRSSFILGKFIGISLAISIATYILMVILLLTCRFGVKDTASTKLDFGTFVAIGIAIFIALVIGLYQNYFLGKPFMKTAVISVAFTITISLLFFLVFDKNYEVGTFGSGLNLQIILASLLTLQAVLILTAVAVAASTRGKVVAGLVCCCAVFLGGLFSEFLFSKPAETNVFARLAYATLPNLQIYWVTESITMGQSIPLDYVAYCGVYTLCYLGATLGLAMILFSNRELRS